MSAAVERAAARAAAAARGRLAAALGALPGIAAEETPEGVAISGRGLRLRALTDPALRDVEELIR